jgi:hypothetical protein
MFHIDNCSIEVLGKSLGLKAMALDSLNERETAIAYYGRSIEVFVVHKYFQKLSTNKIH